MRKPLLLLATAAVLALGLYLPHIVTALESRDGGAEQRQYAMETIQLEAAAPADPLAVMRLLAGGYQTAALKTGNVLTAETAYEAALNALAFIWDYGIGFDPAAYSEYTVSPMMIIAEGVADARVIWQCDLSSESGVGSATLYIDDESGKMLAYWGVDAGEPTNTVKDAATEKTAELWINALQNYYGFETVTIADFSSEKDRFQGYSLNCACPDGQPLTLSFQLQQVGYSTDSRSTAEYAIVRTAAGFSPVLTETVN